jgi:hypothetical protein
VFDRGVDPHADVVIEGEAARLTEPRAANLAGARSFRRFRKVARSTS